MNLTNICQPQIFTLVEADNMVPLLQKISKKHEGVISKLLETQRFFIKSGVADDKIKIITEEVNQQLIEWGTKVTKLGCQAYGGGFVGLDAGTFFYSWRLDEPKIEYWHEHLESPSFRRKLNEFMPGIVIIPEDLDEKT